MAFFLPPISPLSLRPARMSSKAAVDTQKQHDVDMGCTVIVAKTLDGIICYTCRFFLCVLFSTKFHPFYFGISYVPSLFLTVYLPIPCSLKPTHAFLRLDRGSRLLSCLAVAGSWSTLTSTELTRHWAACRQR